jgi:acetyltransferase-like isoleucine patch superfamily enzyme
VIINSNILHSAANRGLNIDPSVKFGKNTRIQHTAIIEEGCEIGDNCFIGHYVVMRPDTKIGNNTVIGHGTVIEGGCSIGSDCLIHAQCHITLGAVIEDKVFIAPGFIGANDPDMVHQRRHVKEFVPQAYTIRRGARIGIGVLVLPGVEIGENAVVGVGSVVTKNVPPFAKVTGVPARIKDVVNREWWV